MDHNINNYNYYILVIYTLNAYNGYYKVLSTLSVSAKGKSPTSDREHCQIFLQYFKKTPLLLKTPDLTPPCWLELLWEHIQGLWLSWAELFTPRLTLRSEGSRVTK